jgi:hypothetical protein
MKEMGKEYWRKKERGKDKVGVKKKGGGERNERSGKGI